MRRAALFAVVGSGVAWAIAVGLGGCSSDAPAAKDTDAGKGNRSSSSSSGDNGGSSTSSSSSSSSSSTGGTTSGDGGAKEAGTTSGAIASNPKKITCGGGADCTADATKRCCWPGGNADAGTCSDGPCTDAIDVLCDEKADCADGEKCCYGDGTLQCNANCGDVAGPEGAITICKLDAECGADKCSLKSCKFDDGGGGNFTLKLKVCGTPANCQ